MIRLTALLAAASLSLAGCEAPRSQTFVQPSQAGFNGQSLQENVGFTVAPPNAPSGPAIDGFARNFLNGLQNASIQGGREYCGYFFIDGGGNLQATPPRAGTIAACQMPAPLVGQGIIASYHTHGAYARGYDNEVPSVIDLMSDFDYGIDGYVSTPGGRVWLVDFQTQSTRQICGLGCVISDPNFIAENEAAILPVYSVQSLRQRNRRF